MNCLYFLSAIVLANIDYNEQSVLQGNSQKIIIWQKTQESVKMRLKLT